MTAASDTSLGTGEGAAAPFAANAVAGDSVSGRSVFLVETVAAGVSVRTVFLTADQKLLEMPAVFPDLGYALDQIDDLRRIVIQHFSQAAQVGAQVIAAQSAAAGLPTSAAPETIAARPEPAAT